METEKNTGSMAYSGPERAVMSTRGEINQLIEDQKTMCFEVRLHKKAITSKRSNVFTLVCRHLAVFSKSSVVCRVDTVHTEKTQ